MRKKLTKTGTRPRRLRRRDRGPVHRKPAQPVYASGAMRAVICQALADETETFAIPDAIPFDEASAFPMACTSSHVAID